MSLPSVAIPLGAMRFNSESRRLEYWEGSAWLQVRTFTPSLTDGGTRGCWGGGGGAPSHVNTIDYINVQSMGDAITFGELQYAQNRNASCASAILGFWGGGAPAATNTINEIIFSSTGNATDYGDMDNGFLYGAACGDNTRGIWALGDIGAGSANNKISYTHFAGAGRGLDFGDLTQARNRLGAFSSPTRGVFTGGYAPGNQTTMDYVQIATLGNASDFGNLIDARHGCSGLSNSIRGITASGSGKATEAHLIASGGKAVRWGDVTHRDEYGGAFGDPTRGIFGGGNPVIANISMISFSTEGNWVDFGDLTQARFGASGCSNGHGGLGGTTHHGGYT